MIGNSILDIEIIQGLAILNKYQDLDSCIKSSGFTVYVGKTERVITAEDFSTLTNLGFGVDSALVKDTADGKSYYCYTTYLQHSRDPWHFKTA